MTISVHTFPPHPRASNTKNHTSAASDPPMSSRSKTGRRASSEAETITGDGHTGLSDEIEDVKMEVEGEDEEEDSVEDIRPVVHIEAKQKSYSHSTPLQVRSVLRSWITNNVINIRFGQELRGWEDISMLAGSLERVWVDDSDGRGGSSRVEDVELQLHLYKLEENSELEQFIADQDDEDGEPVSSASIQSLPSAEIEGLWQNLVYADDLKSRLVQYISTAMQFSEACVDFNIVTWNRMVLLYGPPGTGKTSLCRALAQKLTIRLSDRYTRGKLVEINSHSLFSKWFSESGKLVQRLFNMVHDLVDDEQNFVVVMIDEVESLTRARSAAASGNEPSDAIRVVNALLTQLDKLKEKQNVLVMTTSNLSETIDPAFVDRADIKEYVGNPPPQAIFWILSGCIQELAKKHLVADIRLLTWEQVEKIERINKRDKTDGCKSDKHAVASVKLADIARRCYSHELSGRLLRRIPMLAHARYISRNGDMGGRPKTVNTWLDAMSRVVEDEVRSKISIAGTVEVEKEVTVINGIITSNGHSA